ncbi:MAG TPA: hypothetical protein VL993_01600, partial [Stellaceae bacterium]|nr:hypothetical protein [Stellaceae bacterium]
MRCGAGWAAAATLLVAAPALAQENNDLNFIPEAVQQAPPAPPPEAAIDQDQRIYLENAATLTARRSGLVPTPPPAGPDWEERLFLDAQKDWHLLPELDFAYSGRLNLRAEDTIEVPSHEDVRHDFREGYVSWKPAEGVFFDAGRINLKGGVAAGFNPTDFFKTRAVVEPLSQDPATLREDRLGTAMVEAQKIFPDGALTAAFAPKLDDPRPIYTNTDLPVVRPMFDRTNGQDRLLLKGNWNIGEDLSPELLYYREGGSSRVGANLTKPIGQTTVTYLEWAGGRQTSLIDSALSFGREVGTIPETAPNALPVSGGSFFGNQVAVGASYTGESKITWNFEYHYNEMGFSPQDWRNWFAAGAANAGRAAVTNELWY